MRKIWDKMVGLLDSVGTDKLYHFIAGLIIAAFFAIVCGMEACIVAVFFLGFAKECWDSWQDGNKFDGWDLLATIMGGAVVELFIILRAALMLI